MSARLHASYLGAVVIPGTGNADPNRYQTRRQRLAAKLMNCLEDITTRMHDGYYVDLFVRASNKTAIQMYTKVRICRMCIQRHLLMTIWRC